MIDLRYKEIALIIAKMIIVAIPIHLIDLFQVNLSPFQQIVALHVLLVLQRFGIEAELVQGSVPFLRIEEIETDIAIDNYCTAYTSFLAFFALIWASPRRWRKRIEALSLLPLIHVANVIRISSTIYFAYRFGRHIFEVIDLFLWRYALMFLVGAIWYAWFKGSS